MPQWPEKYWPEWDTTVIRTKKELINLRFDQLAEMTGGILTDAGVAEKSFAGVSIDSRTLREGELFVAIKGERVDGHKYVSNALKHGAAGVMVEHHFNRSVDIPAGTAIISVSDCHEAMLTLAARWRNHCQAKFVGITGSNGKTTTKELAFSLLSAFRHDVYRSPGNFNNLYGAPLSIFAVPEHSSTVILELGISTKREMPKLAELVHPDLILITNVGPSHLEFFGTVQAVARAKLELARKASPEVPVIVNADDKLLMGEAAKLGRPLITFGINAPADFVPERIQPLTSGGSKVTIGGNRFRLPLAGLHQVSNLVAAYAISATLGYDLASVDTEAIVLDTVPMRGQLVTKRGITFFYDCYNANPESVMASLEAFSQIPSRGRRIIILWDMLELGESGEALHSEIGKRLSGYDFDQAYFVGELAAAIAVQAVASGTSENKIWHTGSLKGAVPEILRQLKDGDLVLVKASRAVGLEAIVEAVEKGDGN